MDILWDDRSGIGYFAETVFEFNHRNSQDILIEPSFFRADTQGCGVLAIRRLSKLLFFQVLNLSLPFRKAWGKRWRLLDTGMSVNVGCRLYGELVNPDFAF